MKHRHYDCIVAWADGAKVEFKVNDVNEWYETPEPIWNIEHEYRIKKEPVIEVKYFTNLQAGFIGFVEFNPDMEKWDLKITYQDGKAIKAELAE